MTQMRSTLYICLLLISFNHLFGQTPPSLNSFIQYPIDLSSQTSYGFSKITIQEIQAAFTQAHRAEENQFCLGVNSIVDWQMPSQVEWDATPRNEKVLFLINQERMARAGLDYCDGQGPVKGLPFIGIEEKLNIIAQDFAQDFIDNSFQGFTPLDTLNQLVDNEPDIGCLNPPLAICCNEFRDALFINFPSEDFPLHERELEAYIIYLMIYTFHENIREIVLLQDNGNVSYIGEGYANNYGSSEDEGFLGIGTAFDSTTTGANPNYYGYSFVLTYIDPVPEAQGCDYNCITCLPCPNILAENQNPIPNNTYQAQTWVQSAGEVSSSGDVIMKANDYIQLNQNFQVNLGGVFHAFIDGCSN